MRILRTLDRKTAICIAILVLAGLIPLTWYKSSYAIIVGDWSPYWFNSPQTFLGDMNIWLSTNSFGSVSAYPTLAALFTPIFVLQELGLTNGLIQVIIISGLLICSGLTMFFFLETLLGRKYWALFVGSLFYMFCMLFVLEIFNFVISWAHAFLPLLLTLFIKLIRKRMNGEPSGKHFVCFLFSFSFFMSFLTDNAGVLAIGLLSLFSIFLYLGFTENFLKVTRETAKIAVPTIITSLWWIIPFFMVSTQVVSAPGQNLATDINAYDYLANGFRSSILNIMWFNPLRGWTAPLLYGYTNYYSNPIVILSTFIPFLFAIFGLLYREENKCLKYFCISIILFMIVVVAGTHAPFMPANTFLNNYLPFFGMLFRETQSKFSIIIALFTALLVACTMDSLVTAIRGSAPKTKSKKLIRSVSLFLIAALICSSIIITAGPMFLGRVAEKNPQSIVTPYVEVPVYWKEASEFIANDPNDFRVLVTPDSPSTYMAYDWGYWGADAVPSRLIQKPTIYNTYGYQQKIGDNAINMTYHTLENQSYSEFNSLLSALNVKYILQRNDVVVNFTWPQAVNSTVMKNDLLNDTALENVGSFGELDIYEYKNWNTTHLLTSAEPFEDNATALTSFSIPNNEAVQLSYEQISASEYNLHINASQPFFLFFSESYDSNWKLIGADASWYSIPFSHDLSVNHTSAYGFGNMWYINKIGSYDLKIYYAPESYFLYGISISVLSLSLITVYITLHHYVKSRKKR